MSAHTAVTAVHTLRSMDVMSVTFPEHIVYYHAAVKHTLFVVHSCVNETYTFCERWKINGKNQMYR